MAPYDYDLAIIGGGAAGLTVAAGAARLGAKTLLVEKEPELGGDCLHYGCVPSKTLIKTAHVYHLMKNGPRFGLPAVDPGPVDFAQVTARIREVIAVIQRHDSVARFCKLGARVEFGQPEFIDDHAVRLNGRSVSAGQWVIASGSSADVPRIPGLDGTPYLTNRELFSLEELPASMIILGGGPVACEMAQAFSRLGTRVQVVQRSGQILTREDVDLADLVLAGLQAEGVLFHLDVKVKQVRDLGKHRQVEIERSDGTSVVLEAESLLVALGRTANVEGLGLDKAGVAHDHKGITVNRAMRTSQRHIFAAGDVTGAYQFTHAAGYESGIVISNAVFHLPRKVDYTLLPWCTYTQPELASIGMNEKRAQAAGVACAVWSEKFQDNDRAVAEGEGGGCLKLLLDERERVIGVQILGPHAGELIAEWVALLNGKGGLASLAAAVHPYPTLAEINKRVAGEVFAKKIFSETMRKGLKFFFNLKGRACGVE